MSNQTSPSFSVAHYLWAIVMAFSSLILAYIILVKFDVPNLPWALDDRGVLFASTLSIFLIGLCVVFLPSDRIPAVEIKGIYVSTFDGKQDHSKLLREMEECRPEDAASLNKEIAEKIMGWHLVADDTERLWRYPNGEVVRLDIGSFPASHPFHQGVSLCAHPWINGVNKDDQLSFNPALNYNKSIIDFRGLVERFYRDSYQLENRDKV